MEIKKHKSFQYRQNWKPYTALVLYSVHMVLTLTILRAASIDWIPPMGIPEPEFGIKEDVTMYLQPGETYNYGNGPEPYHLNPQGEPYTHYVDNAHSNSTDTNNPYGTPIKPRKTLPSTQLPDGSVVEMHGQYPIMTFNGKGTRDHPVFIRGQSQDSRTVFMDLSPTAAANAVTKGSSYLILENLKFVGRGIRLSQNTDHISFRYLEITGQPLTDNPRSVCSLAADSSWKEGEHIDHVVFYQNKIHHNGVDKGWPTPNEGGVHGISVGESSYRVWVVDNEIFRNAEDGIHVINFNKRGDPTFVYIGRNKIYENMENAIDVKQAVDTIISQNEMFGYRPTPFAGGSDGSAVVINDEADKSSIRTWVIYNNIYDSTVGLRSQANQSYYVVGNVFHDLPKLTYITSATEMYFVNNTFYNFESGLMIMNGGNYYLHNNLFDSAVTTGNYHLKLNNTLAVFYEIKNNLVYGPNGAKIMNTKGFPLQNCILTLPPLLNAGSLLEGSPAIDKGFESPVYQAFFDLYGLNIRKDFLGNHRPVGSAWDIGAYEFISTSPDSDGDGLLDNWEILYFSSISDPRAQAGVDVDGDGLDNLAEQTTGTSPIDSQSVFRMVSQNFSASGFNVQWTAAPNKIYQIDYSSTLTNWSKAVTITNGSALTLQWTDDGSLTGGAPDERVKRFYRMKTR
jgi:hypothetical protein